jgi:transcriptional regulator with XRE-family HTH domain
VKPGPEQGDKWVLKEWTLAERFVANVVWFRHQAGLTQQELADRIGTNRTVLSALERGLRVPRLDTVLKLAAGLGVDNCELVAWMWWDPPRHESYETPPEVADISGYEVWDFDVPARFRVSPVGFESRERFKDRLRQQLDCWGTMHRRLLRAPDPTPPGCCAPDRRSSRFVRSEG